MKKILIIKAHPRENSFCNALADKYIEGAIESNNDTEVVNLKDLGLSKFLECNYSENTALPIELLNVQKLITWADHLVFVYPTWWATPPALLKVFVETVFTSGFAYKYKQNTHRVTWDKKLKGRSARIIATMDAPPWYYKLFIGDPGFKMMKNGILNFCGIKPVYKNYFGSVKLSSKVQRANWLKKIYKVGRSE